MKSRSAMVRDELSNAAPEHPASAHSDTAAGVFTKMSCRWIESGGRCTARSQQISRPLRCGEARTSEQGVHVIGRAGSGTDAGHEPAERWRIRAAAINNARRHSRATPHAKSGSPFTGARSCSAGCSMPLVEPSCASEEDIAGDSDTDERSGTVPSTERTIARAIATTATGARPDPVLLTTSIRPASLLDHTCRPNSTSLRIVVSQPGVDTLVRL